jgi:TRAP-type C4-dicarboxylate transport system permease small subunit
MNILQKTSDVLDKITKYIVAFLLATMTIVYFAQVVARFVFNQGIYWSEELVRYSCIFMVYLAAASLFKEDNHVAITALEELLPKKLQKCLYILISLINLTYMIFVFIIGVEILKVSAFQTSPNMQIKMSIVYLIFPISMALMFLHTIVNLFNRHTYIAYKDNKSLKDEEVTK